MKSRWMFSVLCGALLLASAKVRAQEPPPGPPPPDALMPGGPVGGRMEILGFGEMHPGKVVPNAPYIAVAVTETKQTLADGNVIDRQVQSNVFRDSQGRTRKETTLQGVGPLAVSGQNKTFVTIHDPTLSTAYVLNADKKLATKFSTSPRGPKNQGQLQGKFEARMQTEIANGTLKTEDLGTKTISGMVTHGTRYTHTIPSGSIGNEKPVVVISERWYSPDLQIVVKSVRNDPRFGQTTYTLCGPEPSNLRGSANCSTNILLQEPAATLFLVPADYTVQQGAPGGHGKGMHRGGPPPGSPADLPPPPGE
jgi:hypothetical protein